jgi:hypothetical protein
MDMIKAIAFIALGVTLAYYVIIPMHDLAKKIEYRAATTVNILNP